MNTGSLMTPAPAHQRWHDLELGMFFHFDIPVYKPGWDWRSWKDLPDPNLYQPGGLDTDQWMEAARAMGARYAIFVAKHCSGFCQWQTDIYPYGVKQSSWRGGRGDVVADFVQSCRKFDILPGLYASVSANGYLGVDNPGLVNRGKGGSPEEQAEYVRICEQMAMELWSRYGELFEIWFDGGAIPVDAGGPDLVPILKQHQPQAIVFQGPSGTPNMIRWVGNERGVAPYPCWSTVEAGTVEDGTEEGRFSGNPDGNLWIPGECDVPIRNHEWFWNSGQEHLCYSVSELMDMYYRSVGRNCNLLLNANPGPDGLVPDADFNRYTDFGREIRNRFSNPLGTTRGEGDLIDLDLGSTKRINHVSIMENIAHGERILEYVIEAQTQDANWTRVCGGESIGHRRLQQFEAIETSRIRLNVRSAKSRPMVRELSVYHVE